MAGQKPQGCSEEDQLGAAGVDGSDGRTGP